MKHQADTALAKWLAANRYSDTAFAAALAEVDPLVKVSRRTVQNWRRGWAKPRHRALAAVERLTGLTAKDFVEAA